MTTITPKDLRRLLRTYGTTSRAICRALGIYPQTMVDILNGRLSDLVTLNGRRWQELVEAFSEEEEEQ